MFFNRYGPFRQGARFDTRGSVRLPNVTNGPARLAHGKHNSTNAPSSAPAFGTTGLVRLPKVTIGARPAHRREADPTGPNLFEKWLILELEVPQQYRTKGGTALVELCFQCAKRAGFIVTFGRRTEPLLSKRSP